MASAADAVAQEQEHSHPVGSTGLLVDASGASQLQVIARYHVWATECALREISNLTDEEFHRDVGLFFRSLHGTLVHLYAGDKLWLSRMQLGVEADVAWAAPLWADEATGADFERHLPERQQVVDEILKGARAIESYVNSLSPGELNSRFSYCNTKGLTLQMVRSLTIMHVCNHGTHHRGQISSGLTLLGRPAPAMDLLYMIKDKALSDAHVFLKLTAEKASSAPAALELELQQLKGKIAKLEGKTDKLDDAIDAIDAAPDDGNRQYLQAQQQRAMLLAVHQQLAELRRKENLLLEAQQRAQQLPAAATVPLSLNRLILQAASDILPAQAAEWCNKLIMHFEPMIANIASGKVSPDEGVAILKKLIHRIKQFPTSTTVREIRLQGIMMGEALLGCTTTAVLWRGRKGTLPRILKKLDEDQIKGYKVIHSLAKEQELEALLLQHRLAPVHLFKHESPLSTPAPPSPEQASATDASSAGVASSSIPSSPPSSPRSATPSQGNTLQHTPAKAPAARAFVLRDWASMPHYSTTLAHFAKPLSTGEADKLIQQLMCALEFLHSRQLAHMDVKPDNIFVDQQGGFWLADFDTVRSVSDVLPTKVPSTPSFVPSDRKSEDGTYHVCAQHDWWMLAMTVADMLTPPLGREMGQGATDSSCKRVQNALLTLGTQQATLLIDKLG